ncbi:MAG: hypothetical protein A2X86_00080 [Bdellovibrionales bacterium GWA2_49_15]|nr:MAG: hypothetical protein A2X86_00080 [Bdellovibrionales bacterium GWA2_49_15]HAZ14439.1 3-beta hydroxysteroid dehydrogenase [Bdellovibrionales bacterium]
MKSILITGGAGFVGSSLAKLYKQTFPGIKVVAFDNLRRRGSEKNLKIFQDLGIDFVHGDVRQLDDLLDIDQEFDLLIEASAEPSVLAGVDGKGTRYLVQTNLMGTLNCLDFAKTHCKKVIFLSSSRVYSIDALRAVPLKEEETRLEVDSSKIKQTGLSHQGIDHQFSTQDFRSLYGTTKLASELFVEEYVRNFGMKIMINRCGVIAGPGQFGKVDQGVFTMWVARHLFKKSLKYIGFNGTGKQVRDLLHIKDLFDLLQLQVPSLDKHNFGLYNVGGGRVSHTSLLEYTKICQRLSGNTIDIAQDKQTTSVDIPWYISDNTKATHTFNWVPKRSAEVLAQDIFLWLKENENELRHLF